MKKTIYLALLIIASLNCYAQWTSHLSLQNCTFADYSTEGPVAGNSAGFFLYASDGSLLQFTKVNHLSDIDLTALSAYGSQVFVGYSNGNLDIVDVNSFSTQNIPELKNFSGEEYKSINKFYKSGSYVYCATDCGIMQVDIQKKEFKTRYKIDNNTTPNVYDIAILNDTIYAATSTGLYRASTKSAALENCAEWSICSDTTSISDVVSFANKVLYTNADTIYQVGIDTAFAAAKNFCNFDVKDESLIINTKSSISIYDTSLTAKTSISKYNFDGASNQSISATNAAFTKNGTLIIADANYGLVLSDLKGNAKYYYPNGPYSNNSFHLVCTPQGLYSSEGGITSTAGRLNRKFRVNFYNGNKWSSFSASGTDALRICYDPNNTDSIFVSSWGTGLYKANSSGVEQFYNSKNSPLKSAYGTTYFIGGIAFDKNSNLFATNSLVYSSALMVRTAEDNEWHTMYYDITEMQRFCRLTVTSNGYIWTSTNFDGYRASPGLYVFDPNGTLDDDSDDRYRGPIETSVGDERDYGLLQLWDENGEVITDDIYDIVEDKTGVIWIGCSEGIVTIKDETKIFTTDKPAFSHIKVPRNDGTNYADYLLDGITVNTIAVDGANRKWIGTATSGAYLVSDDGTETIHAFNKSNSPLPSNDVTSIAIHPKTGEVFFATKYGIVSYAGDAIEPEETIAEHIRVYPNPVKPTFTGSVKMEGFVDGTAVKITDVSGRLVYSTTSLGGQATWWNCKGLDGKRVSTGVYLIWANDDDGDEKTVGKIMVVR